MNKLLAPVIATMPTARALAAVVTIAVSILIGHAPASAGPSTQEAAVAVPYSPLPLRDWVDANGDSLPFYTNEQVEDFLRTAEIVEREDIPVGVTDPIRVKLAKDGTEVHAVFRYVDTVYERVPMSDGRLRTNLKDSCHFEPAAYELAKLLDMDNVPPAVSRRVGRDNGTLQIWVYDAIMENERIEQEMRAPNRLSWIRQVHMMYLFDALIGNDDRTQQNILIDKNWKLWLIDHTRAFYRNAEAASLEKVTFVERGFWQGLQALDRETVEERLDPYLTGNEIDQLMERRERVMGHIQSLLDERGEGAVLYDWVAPGS